MEGSADRLGLVGRGDRGRLYSRHLRESVAPAFVERIPEASRVLDTGSGGGFPGIPLAIVREDVSVTVLEPRERKAAFLERVVLVLGLPRVVVYLGTVEELGRLGREPAYDVVTSRGLRWSRDMIQGMERVLVEGGFLVRFGSTTPAGEAVTVHPLDSGSGRAAQVWGRESWKDLPRTS